jgi:hypothetical protein
MKKDCEKAVGTVQKLIETLLFIPVEAVDSLHVFPEKKH